MSPTPHPISPLPLTVSVTKLVKKIVTEVSFTNGDFPNSKPITIIFFQLLKSTSCRVTQHE